MKKRSVSRKDKLIRLRKELDTLKLQVEELSGLGWLIKGEIHDIYETLNEMRGEDGKGEDWKDGES